MAEVIEVVTVVEAAPAEVFALKLDVDVHAASLRGSGETATTSTGRRRLALGDEVTFSARHFGMRWRLISRITVFESPSRFVDEQTRGPFRSLRHEHLFTDAGEGRTRMTDRMTITAPLGPLGALVARTVLAPYLRHLLRQRAAHIASVARCLNE